MPNVIHRRGWEIPDSQLTPEHFFFNRRSFMAGAAYNGPHAANGLAAMFIATGQDVANVAESHAGITYAQLLDNGDYLWFTDAVVNMVTEADGYIWLEVSVAGETGWVAIDFITPAA